MSSKTKQKDKSFINAPNYKSTPQDIVRMGARRKSEIKKEEMRLRKEIDGYYC